MESWRPNILLVDDDPVVLFSMKRMLEQIPCRTITAGTGEEALSIAGKEGVDLAVLDVMLPDMDGYQVAQTLHVRERTQRLPIIFVTAIKHESRDVVRGYDSGCVEYLAKPLEASRFISKVRFQLNSIYQKRSVGRE